jgi:hypothetical protein
MTYTYHCIIEWQIDASGTKIINGKVWSQLKVKTTVTRILQLRTGMRVLSQGKSVALYGFQCSVMLTAY